MRLYPLATVWAVICSAGIVSAHDTWVETNTSVVRQGDLVHVDLKLGNHGNQHRDFKLASKITLAPCEILVVPPGGTAFDLKPSLEDLGFGPKEGYWSGAYITHKEGLHTVVHNLDTLHGTTRAVKSSKAFFVAAKKLDAIPTVTAGFDKVYGTTLELVPLVDPVTILAPGRPLEVQLVFEGKPLKDTRVSFIPRGAELDEGFDKTFERMTDAEGKASYTPKEGNLILVVAHHPVDAKGEGYDKLHYSATMTINVPQIPIPSVPPVAE